MANRSLLRANATIRDRLQLIDPRVFDEENQPKLRASFDLESTPTSDGAVREQAEKAWQAIQAQPEDILKERKEVALAREQLRATLQENTGLKTQLLAARKQLDSERAERLNHPMVYGMGAALLGMTGLWLYQRRKNIASELMLNTEKIGFKSLTKPEIKLQAAAPAGSAKLKSIPTPTPAPVLETEPQSLPSPWYKKLLSGKSADASAHSLVSDAHTQSHRHYTDSVDTHIASSILGDDSDSEYLDPEFVKDELVANLAMTPSEGQSAIAYLYELRATVQTLTLIEQQDAARDLLLRHIDALPATSAWAYLEYLALCSESDQREAFEGMRQRFRVQFNRLAPYWMESPDSQRDLLGHERAIAEITAVWPSQRALALIENWLTDTAQERRIFHLTAYDDLFDLYDILTQLEEVQDELDFLPTVSLLDLDFEFAMDIKLEAEPEGTARAVPTVKTGDFDVDVNIAFSQSVPSVLNTKAEPMPQPLKALL
jgi:hypothetical protein